MSTAPTSPETVAPPVDLRFAEEALARCGRSPDAAIPVLQALQDHYGYLPHEALEWVCRHSQITPAAITGVATFYDMFRHAPVGKHIVHVCHGTACHVAGADRVEDALRRHLNVATGTHTDPNRQFTIEPVACLGCCTLGPVVRIDEETIGYATPEKLPGAIRDFLANAESRARQEPMQSAAKPKNGAAEIQVCLDSCCVAKGTDRVFRALQETVAQTGARATVKRVGCVGACYRTPMIEVLVPGRPKIAITDMTVSRAAELVRTQFRPAGPVAKLASSWSRWVDTLLLGDAPAPAVPAASPAPTADDEAGVKAFFSRQVHIAMEHFGRLDPLDVGEFLAHDGFVALARCLGVPRPQPDGQPGAVPSGSLTPEQIIETVEKSGLRGRGGAGFPTGQKWRMVRQQNSPTKYVICNGDEGDPGAFMDRMILESFPYRVIEGLAIAAIAVGAHDAIFYIRHEYPNALKRIRAALAECERRGWIGDRLLGSDYPLRFAIKEGAGAFVCGEETALIASVEGRRGMPRLRPPFPAVSGLWEKPTLINNVETLAMVPWILRHGGEAFAAIGTKTSKGTKVFALAGKIRRAGLIEIPMGTTLREIVEEIGGGVAAGRKFKAVQIGGPSGGCVPARLADTPVDYESLRDIGAIMGSGGMVVLDDTACMVDIARYFLQFTQNQSCGKCTFCRIGTKRMLELLEKFCAGKARRRDLEELEGLAGQVAQGSLCGLGKTAPNPVLSTLRYFRDEYEAHLQGRCPAGKCPALIKYVVKDNCTGCTLCAQHCPVNAIPLTPYERHAINLDLCTRCDTCRQVCPYGAVEVK
ncbi:MAG: NAD(P)H-dependent oxidoreductase subunit E [Verrucomicrobia bacterium]|nr:NAD(P)H-dependent oxidoreductase subunit E [Verrucomicrobiota bacterium]